MLSILHIIVVVVTRGIFVWSRTTPEEAFPRKKAQKSKKPARETGKTETARCCPMIWKLLWTAPCTARCTERWTEGMCVVFVFVLSLCYSLLPTFFRYFSMPIFLCRLSLPAFYAVFLCRLPPPPFPALCSFSSSFYRFPCFIHLFKTLFHCFIPKLCSKTPFPLPIFPEIPYFP